MATLFSSTKWTSSEPDIYLTGEYVIGTRTATTVQVRVKLTVSTVTGLSYFGYDIRSRVALAGTTVSDWVTVKGNSPSQWSSPYVTYFPSASGWYTVNQAAANTSMTGTVYMESNAGSSRTANYSGTISFPAGNTAPYWPSGTGARFNLSGIIAEDVSPVTYSWDAARDDQGNPIYYKVVLYRNGTLHSTLQNDTTSRSFTLNPQTYLSAGQSMYFKVYCRDENTSYPSTCLQSNTITKNTLTGAAITSVGAMGFNTDSFMITRTNASNTNGSTSFTYTLVCPDIPVYNMNISSLGTSFTVQVWRSGTYPSGPFVKFSEVQEYVRYSNYTGTIGFKITTLNTYGTSVTSAQSNSSVNLRMDPSTSSISSVTGTHAINGTPYYVINQKPLAIGWNTATDPNGTTVTYTLQESINGGSFLDVVSGLTTTSYSYPMRTITSSQDIKFRVITRTAYGTSSTGSESGLYTLHYYNPPVMSELKIDRNVDQYNITWKYSQSSSISKVLYQATFTLKNATTGSILQTVTGGSASVGTDSYNMNLTVNGLQETTTYPICIECSDTVASEFPLTPAFLYGIVSRYSALLSIREKGIGINAVAGDFADFITKGTASLYGGEPHDNADGSMNLSVTKDGVQNFYIGCYLDSQGVLRSSYTTPTYTQYCFRQIQAHFGDSSQAPLRHRWVFPTNGMSVSKDAEIPDPAYTPWVSFADNSSAVPVGMSMEWNKISVPTGYLAEDGSAVSRITYSALFAVIGTTYGSGDGSTTFNLPDSRGRVAASYSTSYSETSTMGGLSGGSTKTVPVPYHNHTQSSHTHTANHSHTGSSGSAGSHSHAGLRWVDNDKCISISTSGSGGSVVSGYYTGWTSGNVYSNSIETTSAGSHSHSVTVNSQSVTTSSATPTVNYSGTSGVTLNVFQPTITKYKIIKY